MGVKYQKIRFTHHASKRWNERFPGCGGVLQAMKGSSFLESVSGTMYFLNSDLNAIFVGFLIGDRLDIVTVYPAIDKGGKPGAMGVTPDL